MTQQPGDGLPTRLQRTWRGQLEPQERSAVLAWGAFAGTFVSVRLLTHWLKDGHGPKGGGISLGGKHFHHYNIGIALLTAIGAIAIRGEEHHRRHPSTALAYGVGTALIADEAALLIDLQDVYWAKQGRMSVDVAVGIIALGGLGIAGAPFWPTAASDVRKNLPGA